MLGVKKRFVQSSSSLLGEIERPGLQRLVRGFFLDLGLFETGGQAVDSIATYFWITYPVSSQNTAISSVLASLSLRDSGS